MVVIEDYDHMTSMNEIVKWMKLTHLLSIFSVSLRGPFVHLQFTSKKLITFLDVHTRGQ
jgi:hypothetical protein